MAGSLSVSVSVCLLSVCLSCQATATWLAGESSSLWLCTPLLQHRGAKFGPPQATSFARFQRARTHTHTHTRTAVLAVVASSHPSQHHQQQQLHSPLGLDGRLTHPAAAESLSPKKSVANMANAAFIAVFACLAVLVSGSCPEAKEEQSWTLVVLGWGCFCLLGMVVS